MTFAEASSRGYVETLTTELSKKICQKMSLLPRA
jgi:hypothetical protein